MEHLPSFVKRICSLVLPVLFVAVLAVNCAGQVATWTGAGDGVSYSDPGNWNPAVVPINGPGLNYNVIIPDGQHINFDVSGMISGISYGANGSITVQTGTSFNVLGVAQLNSSISASGASTSFTANGAGVSLGSGIRFNSTGGSVITVGGTSYNDNLGTAHVVFNASGNNSLIDASTLTSISNTAGAPGGPAITSFNTDSGGIIDFSGVQTIDGGQSFGLGGFTLNRFAIDTNSDIKFDSLQSITGLNSFEVAKPVYNLNALTTVEGTTFDLAAGTTLNTPRLVSLGGQLIIRDNTSVNAVSLHTIEDATIDLSVGGTLNAPNLTTFRDSSITLEPGKNFVTGDISNIDDSRIAVLGGAQFATSATSLDYNRGSITALRASGNGSHIDASSLTSIAHNVPPGGGLIVDFVAENSGVIDFSGVQTIDGGQSYGIAGVTLNRFAIGSNSDIKFDNLQTISQLNTFDIDKPVYDLNALTTFEGTTFDLAVGTTLNTPNLTSVAGMQSNLVIPIFATVNATNLQALEDTTVNLSVGGTLNAPSLTSFRNSTVTLEPGKNFITGDISNIDNSQIAVLSGATFAPTATSVNYSRGSITALRASGNGSHIDASSLTSIAHNVPPGGGLIVDFVAENGGVIDFSGVQTIDGGQSYGIAGVTLNRFQSNNSGKITFGDVVATQINRFSVDGPNSEIQFDGLDLREGGAVQATNFGTFKFENSFSYRATSETLIDLDNGRVIFDGAAESWLEVGGENLGTNTNGLNNFGINQLQVGGNTATRLILTDQFDNGNRLSSSEAQYVLGSGNNGLTLNNGGTVVLAGLDLFLVDNSGTLFNARDLFGAGDEFVQYGNGFISLTGLRGEILNGEFTTKDLKGFKTEGAGMAEVVETSIDRNPFLQMTAGSAIEVTQNVSTLDEAFFFTFDATTAAESGMLSLLLDGDVLTTWDYSELVSSDFMEFSYLIDNPDYFGLVDVELGLRWDANTGESVSVDNWRMSPIPEPGSLCVLGIAGLLASIRRRRLAA